MESGIQAGLVIIGAVNGLRLLQAKNFWGFFYFVSALIIGVVLGVMGYFGLNIETGIVAGLGSSGLYRIGEKVGGE